MQLPTIIRVLLAIALLGFIGLGINQVNQDREVKQLQKIQIKSNEAKLIELHSKYEIELEHKANSEIEQAEKDKKIEELENERKRLEAELQAKLNRQAEEKEKLATAAKKATGGSSVTAATSNCTELGAKLSNLGVTGVELDAALKLAMRESSCNSAAVNKSSGACGEFQSYPCGKWGIPGTDGYLRAAIAYARGRYGSYVGALSHSLAKNWY